MIGASERADGGCGSSITIALADTADDVYDVACARLLVEAVRRPRLLERIGRTLLAAAKATYDRRCEEAENLGPEYWLLSC
jgi:hypothetical protein